MDSNCFSKKGWHFTSIKKPISNSETIDKLSVKHNIDKIPDSIFGDNLIRIENLDLKFKIEISAFKALEYCKYENWNENYSEINENNFNNYDLNNLITFKLKNFKVKLNENPNPNDLQEEEADSDWAYSTLFKGEISNINYNYEFNKDIEIPKDRLTPENPIQFYDDVYFYEDDLGDFGYTQFRCRYRVMEDCAFVLLRSYVRIDKVVIRIIDTRFFIDFNNNEIIRDFIIKEDIFENIKNKIQINGEFILNQNQSDLVYNLIPMIHHTKEIFKLKNN